MGVTRFDLQSNVRARNDMKCRRKAFKKPFFEAGGGGRDLDNIYSKFLISQFNICHTTTLIEANNKYFSCLVRKAVVVPGSMFIVFFILLLGLV